MAKEDIGSCYRLPSWLDWAPLKLRAEFSLVSVVLGPLNNKLVLDLKEVAVFRGAVQPALAHRKRECSKSALFNTGIQVCNPDGFVFYEKNARCKLGCSKILGMGRGKGKVFQHIYSMNCQAWDDVCLPRRIWISATKIRDAAFNV